jgi:hypothetical protein
MNTVLAQRFADLLDISKQQIFFVGGAPRSGTTWLQQILNGHPDISCRGEGFFGNSLIVPLYQLIDQWRKIVIEKNEQQFRHTGGYPPPCAEDADFVAKIAILQAFQRQCGGRSYRAIGEKTPENVFMFPKLRQILPGAKFIGIARDPRDVVTSTWHYFRKPAVGLTEDDAKFALLDQSLPELNMTARALIDLAQQYPVDTMLLTYAGLTRETSRVVGELFEFLEVSADPPVIAHAIAQASFEIATHGRKRGDARDGEFLRKGIVGDWRSTLTPAMNARILEQTGWMFEHFGWTP